MENMTTTQKIKMEKELLSALYTKTKEQVTQSKKSIEKIDSNLSKLNDLQNSTKLTEDAERFLYHGFTSTELLTLWSLSNKLKKESFISDLLIGVLRICLFVILTVSVMSAVMLYLFNASTIINGNVLMVVITLVLISIVVFVNSNIFLKLRKKTNTYYELNDLLSSLLSDHGIYTGIDLSIYTKEYNYINEMLMPKIKNILIDTHHMVDNKVVSPNHHEIIEEKYKEYNKIKDTEVPKLEESILILNALEGDLSK